MQIHLQVDGRVVYVNIVKRKARRYYVCLYCGGLIDMGEEYYSMEARNRHRTICSDCGDGFDRDDWIRIFEEHPIRKWKWKGR